jgi:hypothetical protein
MFDITVNMRWMERMVSMTWVIWKRWLDRVVEIR